MPDTVKPAPKRRYHAPRRAAAAAQTRQTIVDAAKTRFEGFGWAGTTIRSIAADAEVSPKTIEALFTTKAGLLAAAVDYAIRGDIDETPVIRRESARAVEAAPDAPTMLARHAEYATTITSRSARIARVVESAAASDDQVAALWARMTHNRRFGARWAAETLLAKPGAPAGLTVEKAEQVFLIAIDWGTYRVLTEELGLTPDAARDWLHHYYRRMLLD
ncbi:MAG TPA: TetR family transcriptional regulator [Gaiellaceae bacterium]|nr:TetR family transcriptional regulator [Gaiellaceae bacterium]